MVASCPAVDLSDKTRLWNFCPNIGAAYLFTILFALTSCVHLAQAILHRKPYTWVIIVSGLLQTVCYIFRVLSIRNPASTGVYSAWFVLILVAPLWTNAFAYMVMGRMVYNFASNAKLMGVKAWRLTLYFVIPDIIAFFIQVAGAIIASGEDTPKSTVLTGLHIYMGGVGFQQFFVLVFSFLVYKFHKEIRHTARSSKKSRALQLLYVEHTVLFLITIRIIFRLIEYSQGLDSTIPNHEVYQYVFDSLPMFVALVIFNIVHPGRMMPGRDSDFPSRKERKNYFKMNLQSNDGHMLPIREGPGHVSMPEEQVYPPEANRIIPIPGYVY